MRTLESYHLAWLDAHPWRSEEWFRGQLRDGFDVHHPDGDHGNDHPDNLVLIEHSDHMMLHGGRMMGRIGRFKDDWDGEMIDVVPTKRVGRAPSRKMLKPKRDHKLSTKVKTINEAAAYAAFYRAREQIWGKREPS